jgi:hypothetical protein
VKSPVSKVLVVIGELGGNGDGVIGSSGDLTGPAALLARPSFLFLLELDEVPAVLNVADDAIIRVVSSVKFFSAPLC